MKKMVSYFLLVILFIMPVTASSSDGIPNANLRITVQQKEDGKISKGFHVLELSCREGQCSLSSITLNQCMESGSGKKAFYPKVQFSATWADNLKVRNDGHSLFVQETGSDALVVTT